jgi:hypothetical protein
MKTEKKKKKKQQRLSLRARSAKGGIAWRIWRLARHKQARRRR